MSSPPNNVTPWLRMAFCWGVLALFCYFCSAVFSPFPFSVERLLFYAFGPSLTLATYALGRALRADQGERADRPLFDLATLSTCVAGIAVSMMAVIQDTNFTLMGKARAAAQLEATKDTLHRIMQGINNVQLSLDIVFDIWISTGTCLFALGAIVYFGDRLFGGLGVVIGAGALVVNFMTLPIPPAESGLFDPGPFVATWLGCFLTVTGWRLRPTDTPPTPISQEA